MGIGSRLLWGGLGWAFGGPIGAIVGYTLATMSEARRGDRSSSSFMGMGTPVGYPRTKPGDFTVSLLVLFGYVMKADKQLLKTELEYVKQFLSRNFGVDNAKDLMILFKDILKQEYSLSTVCSQIKRHMDHPSRLEMIHVLFGLSQADNHIHPLESEAILKIARYLGISQADFNSIKAMFVSDTTAAYQILKVDPNTSPDEIKRAYRKMANKYHPDKVHHLGDDFQRLAEEKFKAISDAYRQIKKERQFT